ncbi:galactokinase [candidate division KSB1 bacterium]
MNKEIIGNINLIFREIFGKKSSINAKAPGRANIIGEHTDYNGGFVLPIGIDRNIYTAASKNNENNVNVYSYDFQNKVSFNIDNLQYDNQNRWSNYLKGVINEFKIAGYRVSGFNMVFGGDIPVAAGLSSSAAVELATAITIKKLFNLKIDKIELAKLCQKAENNFVGVKCGIMDQFTSSLAITDQAILLDCKTLQYKYIPFILSDFIIVLCNTNKKRELVDSEYNRRKKECESGVRFFKKINPGIEFLRDVDLNMFESNQFRLPENVRKRCEHVIYENERVLKTVESLKTDAIPDIGVLLFKSHNSLKNLYEVSCKELDIMVNIAARIDGCIGSRMMGAGFGGCTINLVKKHCIEEFSYKIKTKYRKKTKIDPDIYICKTENGAEIIK